MAVHAICEVAHQVLAQTKVAFAVLENDFKSLSHGVHVVSLKESEFGIGCDKGFPLRTFVPSCKE